MTTTLLDPVLHAVIALGLLAAYCVLWSEGHQDPVLLGLLGGQLGGLGVSQVAQRVSTVDNPPAPVAPASGQTTAVIPPQGV